MNQQIPYTETPNLLEAYRMDHTIRDRCQEKGIYVNFTEEGIILTMYLTSGIEDSSYYHEFSELCAAMNHNDTTVIFGDSGGGYLSGAQLITRTLNNCQAYSICIITSLAASAMTIIALACDELRMEPHSHFMIHAPSWGEYPKKMHELKASAEFSLRQQEDFISDIYRDFLTPEEIVDVIKGGDVYLTADDTTARFERIKERRMKQQLEYEQEHIKEHIENLKNQLGQLEARVKPQEKPKTRAKKA